MKNGLLAILISFSICACTAIPDVATPIATSTAASSDANRPAAFAKLRAELETILESDQKVRESYRPDMDQKELRALSERMETVDTANQARLEEIVKQHGWPETKDVGSKAAYGAFYVVQHAPPDYKKRYFQMVQQAMERGDIAKSVFVMLDDRIRMYDGQPQRYGTQITNIKGVRAFWQIEDEANVDKRRAEVGLGSLAEYAKRNSVPYIPYVERVAREAEAKAEVKK
jgi:hypothetical protein